jgi:FkbM family methyltransferase
MRMKKSSPIPRSLVSISFRNLQYPFFIRQGTIDVTTVINNVIREEYGKFQPASEPQWMIDAGAYIGDTTAYFLSRFPYLKVIALEPHIKNYEIACKNLTPYGERVVLLNKGLWSRDQKATFGGAYSGASIRDKGWEINCISLPTILDQFSIPRINILKMDIEGAEEAIFSSSPEGWLDRIDLLIIELHGQKIMEVVLNTLRKYHFSMKKFRSVFYCTPSHEGGIR